MTFKTTATSDARPMWRDKMAQLMGATNKRAPELTSADKRGIMENLQKLFYGLAWANWMRGMTLGAAWYAAGKQMESFAAPKGPNNPAVDYMRQIIASARVRIARVAMTHPNRDDLIACPDDKRDEWGRVGGKMTQDALAALNTVMAQYAPGEQSTPPRSGATMPFPSPSAMVAAQMQQYQRERVRS